MLSDYGIIEGIKPINGGWRFIQVMPDSTTQRIPRQGALQTGRMLVEAVTAFRVTNGVPVGNVEQDVAEYIAKASPQNDRNKGNGPWIGKPRPENYVLPIERLRKWLDEMLPKRPRLVLTDEATERAAICVKCIQNISWKTGCGDCNQEVDYRGNLLRGTTNHPLDDALKACRLHGVHIPSAIFIDRESLPDRMPDAPPTCWIPSQ